MTNKLPFRAYVDACLSVVPIRPNSKVPGWWSGSDWAPMGGWERFCSKLPTEKDIAGWEQYPACGFGLACGAASKIVAVDVDCEGEIRLLIESLLPPSPCRKVGKRGFTAFYRYERQQSTRVHHNGTTIVEILSTGRQTVLPPSMHPDNIQYKWLTPDTLLDIPASELPSLPADFVERLKKALGQHVPKRTQDLSSIYFKEPADRIWEALKFIAPEDYHLWIEIGMAIKANSPDDFKIWDKWSQRSKKYNPKEMAQKWASFDDFGGPGKVCIDTLFWHARLGGWQEKIEHVEILEGGNLKPIEKVTMESLAASAPGLVGQITDWIIRSALRPQPALALAGALTIVGTLKSHKQATYTNLRTNLYCLGIGESGCGKNHVFEAAKFLFKFLSAELYLSGEPQSDTAVLSSLQAGGSKRLVLWDEIGMAMRAMGDPRAPIHLKRIIECLMKIYSCAGSTFFGKEYANRDEKLKRIDLDQPCLSCLGMSTPVHFQAAMTGENVIDGLLSRWLIFRIADPDVPFQDNVKLSSIPTKIMEGCEEILKENVSGNLVIEPKIVLFSEQAARTMGAIAAECEEKKKAARAAGYDPLWVRAAEHTAKIALVCATGEISESDVKWAWEVAKCSISQLCEVLSAKKVDSRDTDIFSTALNYIGGLESGCTMSQFTRKFQRLSKRQRDEILKSLLDADLIYAQVDKSGGRDKITFFTAHEKRESGLTN